MISYRYNPLRARQLTAAFLRLAPNGIMNYTKLMKLLYIAEREHILSTGSPITGDRRVALPSGPILSDILDCIRGVRRDEDWRESFETIGYDLKLIRDPGDGELSRFIDELVESIYKRHEADGYGNMIKHTHEFPEWIENKPNQLYKSHEIPVEAILTAGGKSSDEIASITAFAAENFEMDYCLDLSEA